jgi:hypothetical protein
VSQQDPGTGELTGFDADPGKLPAKHITGSPKTKLVTSREIQKSGLWQDVWRNSIGTVVGGPPPSPPVIGSAQGS